MKKLMTVVLSMVFAVGMAGVAVAGSIDSPGAPGSAASKMPAMGDIYTYLTTGTPVPTPGTSFTEPTSGPGSTGNTLTEIYAAVATPFPQCDALPADVKLGKKFFCTVAGNWGVKTGTYEKGLLKTGQTSVYATNDDGTYQKGVAFNLSAGSDNTVHDAVTGLQWYAGSDPGEKTWLAAITWAEGLVQDGKSDWRLPNITELQTLFVHDAGQSAPYINQTMFPGTATFPYWSSTTAPANVSSALYASFGGAFTGTDGKASGARPRAVRGGN